MEFYRKFSPEFEKRLIKLKRKDKILFQRLTKKIKEILQNPEHYKTLKYELTGTRRAHVGSFVIAFEIKGNVVQFKSFKHHDFSY